jgi:hypothetical protein
LRPFVGRTLKIPKLTKPGGAEDRSEKLGLDGSAPPFNPRTQGLTLTIAGSGGTIWQATIAPNDPDWKLAGDTLNVDGEVGTESTRVEELLDGLPGQPFEMRAKTGKVP